MMEYLKEQNIDVQIIEKLEKYRKEKGLDNNDRSIRPEFKYYGKEALEEATAALLAGKINLYKISFQASRMSIEMPL